MALAGVVIPKTYGGLTPDQQRQVIIGLQTYITDLLSGTFNASRGFLIEDFDEEDEKPAHRSIESGAASSRFARPTGVLPLWTPSPVQEAFSEAVRADWVDG